MKFVIAQGSDGQWYWHLVRVRGGKTIADGAEGYATKSSCVRAVGSFRRTGVTGRLQLAEIEVES